MQILVSSETRMHRPRIIHVIHQEERIIPTINPPPPAEVDAIIRERLLRSKQAQGLYAGPFHQVTASANPEILKKLMLPEKLFHLLAADFRNEILFPEWPAPNDAKRRIVLMSPPKDMRPLVWD